MSVAAGFGRIWVALRDSDRIVSIGAGDSQLGRTATQVSAPVKVLASGSQLWALSLGSSALYPLDPRSGAVGEPVYSPVGDPIDMVFAGGELWLLGAREAGLSPVNARLGRLVRSGFDLPGRILSGLSSSRSTIWVGEPSRGSLLRIDAANVGVSELRAPADVRPDLTAVGRCGVWVASHAGLLDLIDTRTGRPIAPALRIGNSIAAISSSAGGVWASDPVDGTVVYVRAA